MAFSFTKFLKGLVIKEENTNTPREIEIYPSGTSGTKTTLTSSQTGNVIVILPNTSDTLVARGSTDTLTNKTIDATANTVSNISNSSIANGAGIDASKIANGTVSNTEFQFLDGVTSSIQTQLTNNSNSISNHISNSTGAHAASAISNVPSGNLAATDVQAALNELQTDVDTRALNSALTSHTGASSGVHGVTGSVVGTTDTQTLTNKTLTSPVISSISNTGTLTLPTSTDTLVGRATTDTLTNKTISGASNTITNVSLTTGVTGTLPIANGGTGQTAKTAAYNALSPNTSKGDIEVHDGTNNVRQAIGTDGQVLVADSAQANGLKWANISGIKNYILNEGAESNTSGWATYADAAASRPVDGTGGVANITLTRTTSTPLRGNGSFLITKDAVIRQGQGVSFDFTIDQADQAKVLNISFDWEVASGTYSGGTPSTDSDLIVYIYDVTNARLIEPAPIKMDGAVVGADYRYVGSFQTTSNSTSYRLILHCATVSASAYTVKFDNVVVGPSVVTTGAYIGDWQSYTPTISAVTTAPTKGTTTVDAARWRRVGDSMEITYTYRQTSAGTGGTGAYLISIPSGYSIDSSKIFVGTAAFGNLGTFSVSGTPAGQNGNGIVYAQSSTNLGFMYTQDVSGNFTSWASTTGGFTNANMDFSFHAMVPIAGWGTSQVLSSETDTRVVALDAPWGNAQTLGTSGVDATATGGTPNIDTHGGRSGNIYIIPISGVYSITYSAAFAANATGKREARLQVSTNGGGSWTDFAIQNQPGSAAAQTGLNITKIRSFNAADQFRVVLQQTSGGSLGTVSDGTQNYLSIRRISGPSQIAASEIIQARLTTPTSQHNSTTAKVTGWVATINSHGAWSTTNNEFTAPVSGTYAVFYRWGVTNTGFSVTAAIRKNGAQVSRASAYSNGNVDANPTAFTLISLVAGDKIDFDAQTSSVTLTNTDTNITEAIIYRVGN